MPSTRSTERILLGAAFILAASNSLVFALMGNLQDRYGFSDAGLGFIAAAAFLSSFLMMVLVAPLAELPAIARFMSPDGDLVALARPGKVPGNLHGWVVLLP